MKPFEYVTRLCNCYLYLKNSPFTLIKEKREVNGPTKPSGFSTQDVYRPVRYLDLTVISVHCEEERGTRKGILEVSVTPKMESLNDKAEESNLEVYIDLYYFTRSLLLHGLSGLRTRVRREHDPCLDLFLLQHRYNSRSIYVYLTYLLNTVTSNTSNHHCAS